MAVAVGVMLLAGCSDGLFGEDSGANGGDRIQLSGDIDQLAVTRVNDNGFCDGDCMGVYVVDYRAGTPGTLQLSGNRADNVRHTYDASAGKWNSAYDIYWKDKHTHIDVYGYSLRCSAIRAPHRRTETWADMKPVTSFGARWATSLQPPT